MNDTDCPLCGGIVRGDRSIPADAELDVDRLADAIHAWHDPEAPRLSCRPARHCRTAAAAIAREYAALAEEPEDGR